MLSWGQHVSKTTTAWTSTLMSVPLHTELSLETQRSSPDLECNRRPRQGSLRKCPSAEI